jgi:signal transduction histidine kinase
MDYQFKNQTSFKSIVARRLFTMFVICALGPLLVISAISFFFVGSQLKNQAYERLRQQCKMQGFQIYEHLISLKNEIAMAAQDYTQHGFRNQVARPYNANNREGSGFRRIFLLKPDGATITLIDHLEGLRPIESESLINVDKNQNLISLINAGGSLPLLFIRQLIDPAQPAKGFVVGEIDPLYLFGIGTEGALPPGVNMEVRQLNGEILISSTHGKQLDDNFDKALARNAATGKFESTYNGKSHINSYWSLFLRHHFGSPDWIIIFSQSKASILSPVIRFAYIFILLILLTFFSIILFSIHAIRKRTTPIETLKRGTMRIADGEFGHQVTISSNDEFEDLSITFNAMSNKLKKDQALLLQAAKMSTFGQMGAGIVHEIGQPLSAISGYAELMRMGGDPGKHQRYLETICNQTQRLAQIISKFRVFSRSTPKIRQELNLNDILETTHDLLGHSLKIKSVKMELEEYKELPIVLGDKDALQQVFINLIVNAIDAFEEKQEGERFIWVKSYVEEQMVHVDISDNGCGISTKDQQSIFDPFFTTKSEDKGTGLGLAVTSSIIHEHEGKITVESAVDEGTRFIISLPVAHCRKSADADLNK